MQTDAFRAVLSGEPKSQTVILQDHVGVCGAAVQVISEEYSSSVRRYLVRRRTPHTSPDVFLGPKLGNLFSLFDIMVFMMVFLMYIPWLSNFVEERYFPSATAGSGGGINGANSVINPHLVPTASNAIVIGGSTLGSDFNSDPSFLLLDGSISGSSTIDGLVHLVTSTIPWFVLSQVEETIRTVTSIFPASHHHQHQQHHSHHHHGGSSRNVKLGSDALPSAAAAAAAGMVGSSIPTYPAQGWLVQMVHPAVFYTIVIGIFMIFIKIPMRVRAIAEEEILIIRGVGVQITLRNFLGSVVSQRFIDCSLIRSVFIHEGFFRHRVIFFLAILVENKSELEVLFQESLPRLAALRPILCGIRAVLYPSKKEFGPSLADIASGKAAALGNNSGNGNNNNPSAFGPNATLLGNGLGNNVYNSFNENGSVPLSPKILGSNAADF